MKIGEIVVRFDREGNILEAYGREYEIEGEYKVSWKEKPTNRFFYVNKDRVLTNLKFYVDWYKEHLEDLPTIQGSDIYELSVASKDV